MTHLTTLFPRLRTVLRRVLAVSMQLVTQPGRHDLVSSVFVTVSVLVPLVAQPVAAQVGVGPVEQILCQSGGINIGAGIGAVFGLLTGYFFLKGLLRVMKAFDKGGDPTVNSKYVQLQIRDAGYSFAAGLLPALFPTVLVAAGITPVACLVPG